MALIRVLAGFLEQCKFEHEQQRDDVNRWRTVISLAAQDLDRGFCDETDARAMGD